jgi:UDP-N-acetylmuramoyl-L-alanyl-D-glutamate--2,6-diaminopimelate ligase
MKELNSIISSLSGVIALRGRVDRNIRHIRYDSRRVEQGDLFVAVNGREDQALRYVEDAVSAGAAAVVLDDPERMPAQGNGATFLLVEDARVAMAEASAELEGHPSRDLRIYGITGTNGKTTVAHVLYGLLRGAGFPTGLIGTLGVTIETTESTGYTTPESPELQQIFRRMANAGLGNVIMEVSSHALQLHRVEGVNFFGGIYTNITQDHLDFHTTFQDYLNAKKRLFDRLDAEASAVVNIDDLQGPAMVRDTDAGIVWYGHGESADLRIDDTDLAAEGSAWVVNFSDRFGGGSDRFYSRLVGSFNVINITAACGMALVAGVDRRSLPDLVSRLNPVPGRMETIRLDRGGTAIVDYAHTPAALEILLQTTRTIAPAGGKIHVVFGCGGDRDRTKRPIMGEVAGRLADFLYITSDNPRSEDPEQIISEVAVGTGRGGSDQLLIVDRAEAIVTALRSADPDDVVVVAGKGHETSQIIGSETREFDDREVIRGAGTGATIADH